MGFYLPRDASRRRIIEAQHARNNRAEIVRARSTQSIEQDIKHASIAFVV